MEGMIERCVGVDIHQAKMVATVRVPDGNGGRRSTHSWQPGLMSTRSRAISHPS